MTTLEQVPQVSSEQAPRVEHQVVSLDWLLARTVTINWEVIAYGVLFILAVITRFADLGTRVMSHDESLHTKFAWDLYRNGNFQHTPLMHGPLLFHAVAFSYVLFGDTDFSARIYTALIGVLVVMMPLLFRRWLGRIGAVLTSTLFLISPMLMYYSRYIRHDLPAILFALVMVYAIFQYVDGEERVRRKSYWLYILAAAMSLLLASKEVAFIYIALFGSFLALYWLIRLAQQYLRLRLARSLLCLLTTGIIVGAIAALAMTVIITIIPPDRMWSFTGGFHILSQPLFERALTWISILIGVLAAALVGTAIWTARDTADRVPWLEVVLLLLALAILFVPLPPLVRAVALIALLVVAGLAIQRRSGARRRLPWREIASIAVLATVACTALLIFEDVSHVEVGTIAPTDPNAAQGAATEVVSLAPIILAYVVGVLLIGLMAVAWITGIWGELKRFAEFDVLIVVGSLILPWLTAFIIYATGARPTDYSTQGILRAVAALIPFAAVAVTAGMLWNWRVWLPATGIFMAIFAFFFTTMFTNGQGLASGMIGSLGYWLEQQEVRRGSQPQYYYVLILLPIYEFLPVIGAAAAGIVGLTQLWRFRRSHLAVSNDPETAEAVLVDETLAAEVGQTVALDAEVGYVEAAEGLDEGTETEALIKAKRIPPGEFLDRVPFLLFVGYWAVLNVLAYTVAGEKMPWLTTHLTVPLAMLTGWYGGRIIEKISRKAFWTQGWRLLILVPLFVVAFNRVVLPWLVNESPFRGLEQGQLLQTGVWLAALVVAGGALFYIAQVLARVGWSQFWRIGVAGVGIVLMFMTARFALMASFITYDYATEFLVYAHSAPAVKTVLDELEELSYRTTDGLNIRVAYDNEVSWPMSWYFRNYGQAVYFANTPSVQVLDDAVAVLVGEANRARVEPLLGDRYYHFEHVRMWWPMQEYFNLTVERIDNAFDFNPNNITAANIRRGMWEIWWNRDYSVYGDAVGIDFNTAHWPVADRMHFYVRKDVAAQIWDMGVGATVTADLGTSDAELWVPRAAEMVWGQEGTAEGQLNHPRGAAVAPDGTVYVADSLNHRIQAFDSDGNFLFAWGLPEVGEHGEAAGGHFNQPWGIAVGPDGNVYVADTWNHRVQVFTPEGEFVRAWGQLAQLEAAASPTDFWGPRDIAVDAEGLVYVADTGNKRVRVYTPEGVLVRDIGSGGTGAGQLNEPVGLAIHPDDGRLFVADTWNRRIQVFDRSGQYLTSWLVNAWYGDRGNRPYLALDAERGQLYVTDPDAARVLVYGFNGTALGSFGQPGPSEGALNATQFDVLGGITIDSQGRVFVVDAGRARILRFAPWNELAVMPPVEPPVEDQAGQGEDGGEPVDQESGGAAGDAANEATEEVIEEPAAQSTEEVSPGDSGSAPGAEATGEVTEEADG